MRNERFYIKLFLFILIIVFPGHSIQAQVPVKLRSTISAGASSGVIFANGNRYYLQQSTGQLSVIGILQSGDHLIRQGFIQPLPGTVKELKTPGMLAATIYPNPFSDHIVLSISELYEGPAYVTLYDLNGRIVLFSGFEAAMTIDMDLSSLQPSVYIIRVNTPSKCFYSRIIKL